MDDHGLAAANVLAPTGPVAILVDELKLNEDFKLEESSCHAKLEVRLGYILKIAQFNDTLIKIIRKITLGQELENHHIPAQRLRVLHR